MKPLIVCAIFLSICCCYREASAFCGERVLIGHLARASVRAAEWTRAHLHGNIPTTEGHILAAALHSQRLVGHSLNVSSEQISARLKSEIDTAGRHAIPTGRVAHYIHGIYAVCQNPRLFHRHNLVKWLKTGVAKFPRPGFDHYFQYSSAVLAMCVSGHTHRPYLTNPLVKRITSWAKSDTYGGVDTVAMATMALACTYDGRKSDAFKVKKSYRKIRHALQKSTNWLITKQLGDGRFGNSITTALVTQALLSAESIVGPYKKWNCPATMRYLLEQQHSDGSYGDLMATIQVMPVLIGAIPADLKKLKCHKKTKKKSMIRVCVRLQFPKNSVNNLVFGPPPPMYVNVTSGTSAHKILRLVANRDQRYHYTTRRSSYGYIVTSIYGVVERPEQKKHWMLFSAPDKMAPAGIDTYRPQHNTCVIFKYMKISS